MVRSRLTYAALAAAVSLAFDGGRIVERAIDGDERLWGTVVAWEPPDRVAFSWHPGQGDAEATEVEVRFLADEHGTRVELEHRGWDRLGGEAEGARTGYTGPSAWGLVLDHFGDAADRFDADPAIDELRSAYRAFYDEARRGGFGDPPAGEWTAPQVVAHVALTDASLAAGCRRLIAERDVAFDNAEVQEVANLDRYLAGRDLETVIAEAERASEDLVLLTARLDQSQRETEVPCHLTDGDRVVVDEPLPWGQLALTIQAQRHLPLHTDQLASLRPS